MKMIGIDDAAARLGVTPLYLRHIIDVGDVMPTVVDRYEGELWRAETVILFSETDLAAFEAEIRERRFHHVFEQHGYVVPADAKFACAKGWERVIRKLATELSAIPGPPPDSVAARRSSARSSHSSAAKTISVRKSRC